MTVVNLWAVDPGGHTGYVNVVFTEKWLGQGSVYAIKRSMAAEGCYRSGTVQGDWADQAEHLLRLIKEGESLLPVAGRRPVRSVLLMENFQFRSSTMTNDTLTPVKLLAILPWALKNRDYECHEQQPGERSIITDERLRRWGLWKPGKAHGHEMDALRHALVFMRALEAEG